MANVQNKPYTTRFACCFLLVFVVVALFTSSLFLVAQCVMFVCECVIVSCECIIPVRPPRGGSLGRSRWGGGGGGTSQTGEREQRTRRDEKEQVEETLYCTRIDRCL